MLTFLPRKFSLLQCSHIVLIFSPNVAIEKVGILFELPVLFAFTLIAKFLPQKRVYKHKLRSGLRARAVAVLDEPGQVELNHKVLLLSSVIRQTTINDISCRICMFRSFLLASSMVKGAARPRLRCKNDQ